MQFMNQACTSGPLLVFVTVVVLPSLAEGDLPVDLDDKGYVVLPYPLPLGNLTCHLCFHRVHGENCIHMKKTRYLKQKQCKANEKYCSVSHLKRDGKLTTFSRRCAEICKPGCESTRTSINFEVCESCCQTNLCNDGMVGSAVALGTERTRHHLFMLLLWTLMLL